MSTFGNESFSHWSYLPPKREGETIRHTIDFTDRMEEADAITSVDWASDPSGVTFSSETHSDHTATALLSSGTDGTFHEVTAEASTSNGLVLIQSVIVPVGNVYDEPDTLTMRRVMFMAREFLRDHPEGNELNFGALQSSWQQLRHAVQSALSDWNSTTPPTRYSLDQFPPEARHLLYQKTAVEALRSAAQEEGRNQYEYSDQGFATQENTHGPMFMQFAERLNVEYEKKKKKLKLSRNTQSFWGGASIDSAHSRGRREYDLL